MDIAGTKYQLELRLLDDASDPSRATTLIQRLLDDNVDFFLGSFGSNIVLPTAAFTERAEKPMVQAGGGSDQIFNQDSLRVGPGTITALIGSNGPGESTIFNLVTGDLALTAGEILFQDERIDGYPRRDLRRPKGDRGLPGHAGRSPIRAECHTNICQASHARHRTVAIHVHT